MEAFENDVSIRRVVVFDFDGTLADTLPGITETAHTVLLAHGFDDEAMGDLTRLVGPPFPQAFSMVYGVSEEEAASITADYRLVYQDLGLAGWPLFDGIRELLSDLRAAGRLTATASSKNIRLLSRALSDNGVTELFDAIEGKLSDDEDTKSKAILRALDDLAATADEAVMVGDRCFDVEAAAVLGIPCVGVTYGHTSAPGELESAGAVAVAKSVDELEAILLGRDSVK